MPHPGIALAILVGVGIGAVLYYVFTERRQDYENNYDCNREDNQEYEYPNNRRRRSQPSPNSWDGSNSLTGNSQQRRRLPKPDQSNKFCSICLDYLAGSIKILPCEHTFHETCIQEWYHKGQANTRNLCPLCRTSFKS